MTSADTAFSSRRPRRYEHPTARAVALSHVLVGRPDLDLASRFLSSFGLVECHRGDEHLAFQSLVQPCCYRVLRTPEPSFIGFGLEVATANELLALSQLPGATFETSASTFGPKAAAEMVVLHDPSGYRIEVSLARKATSQAHLPRSLMETQTSLSAARVDSTQRVQPVAPEIVKLGHVVLEVARFNLSLDWYCQHLGFIPSDVQVLPGGEPVVAFLRLNRGNQPTDHHTVALGQSFRPSLGHFAFEVLDTDAVGIGNRILHAEGWKHSWGIGRHLLGSQVFDYWEDPWGDKHEHYCDGDLFTASNGTGLHPLSKQSMAQWGPEMPAAFTRPKISLATVRDLISNLREGSDVTFSKLRQLAKIFN
ncbi:VOC family protein [Roseateles chitinivorans]|uniref:VOC family protein n=1 Tax=Roseateles chitinivorans TaxID=2917965 RepID=UPI003D66B378